MLDGNVELPPLCELECNGELYLATGEGLRRDVRTMTCGTEERERSNRRRRMMEMLLGFMQTHMFKAANTFCADRRPTWEAWGEHRSFGRIQKVLDYILVPSRWECTECEVSWCYARGGRRNRSRLSDHALLTGQFASPGRVIVRRDDRERVEPPAPSLVGYRCVTWGDEFNARRRVDRSLGDVVFRGLPARSLELEPASLPSTLIQSFVAAPDVDFTTAASGKQRPPVRPTELTRLLERWRELPSDTTPEEKKRFRSEINLLRRRYRRDVAAWKCPLNRRKTRHHIKHLVVEGQETEDRDVWREELGSFCRNKLSSEQIREENSRMMKEIQEKAREELRSSTYSTITMALLGRARARLRTQRATGPDRVPCEVLKCLPWTVLRNIRRLFDDMLHMCTPYPSSWRDILISFMPKLPGITDLKDGRLLCMQNAIARWYSTCIVILVEQHVERNGLFHPLGLYGFQSNRTTNEITASLKHIGQHASTWGKGETAHLANADILQAFDHCTVDNVQRGLQHAHVPYHLQYAFLDPLCDSVGTVCHDGIEVEGVKWDRCIRTGGAEGPLGFNLIIAAMWQETFRQWDRQNIGYQVCFKTGDPVDSGKSSYTSVVNHFVWADNCYILARSREELAHMIHDLTVRLYDFGMRWKPSSLLYMVFGAEAARNAEGVILSSADLLVPFQNDVMRFRRVTEMTVLGIQLFSDYKYSSHLDVDSRIEAARRTFYSQAGYFRNNSTPLKDKFLRYQQKVQSIALFGADGCTADSDSLHALHAFEGKCLCFMLRCRREPDESYATWNERRYKAARSKFAEAGYHSLVQRFLRAQWLLAKDVSAYAQRLYQGEDMTDKHRAWSDARMCLIAFGISYDTQRTLEGEALRALGKWRECGVMKRWRSGGQAIGQRCWQTPFHEFFGPRWWEVFQGGLHSFMQFATHHCTPSMIKLFQKKCKGIHDSNSPVFLAERNEEHVVTDDDSPAARLRFSKRLAIHNMKSTSWDVTSGGVPLEITGDSLLIICWLCGLWKTDNRLYQARVDNMINTLEGMCCMYGVRPAEAGRDLLKHEFREWNEKADLLTHQAREGHQYTNEQYQLQPYEQSCYEPCLIKAGFDGGVCSLGAGSGAWIQIGLRSRFSHLSPTSSFSDSPQIIFKDVYVCSFALPDGSTVTDTELSAAECVIAALPRVLQAYFSDKLCD